MEKMRRARINDSLNEMKGLVLDLLHKDVSFFFLSVVKQNQLWAEVPCHENLPAADSDTML